MTSPSLARHRLARCIFRLALPLLALPAGVTLADSVTLRSGGATTSGITYDNVHVDRIEGGQIFYTLNGEERSKDAHQVASMKLDDEPAFNDAEANYAAQKWSDAADGYAKVLSSTDKAWLKDWVAPHLLDAANHANRFDVAVVAWIQIANKDPATAGVQKPTLSQDKSSLDSAATKLGDAARTAKGDSKQLILGLLLDVDNARKDTAGAAEVAKQLQTTVAAPSPGAVVSGSPNASASAASAIEGQTKLTLAKTALADKNYDQAVTQIDGAAPLLTDPVQQAEALFIRAQGLEGKAAVSNDADAWKDAALAYMRVYAHFHDTPNSSHCAAALLRTADIEENHLREPQAATVLYQKIVAEYKDSPEAQKASAGITRLANAKP